MHKPFDYKDVEAALKRAGKVATTGTREERAGRFSTAKDAKPPAASKKS